MQSGLFGKNQRYIAGIHQGFHQSGHIAKWDVSVLHNSLLRTHQIVLVLKPPLFYASIIDDRSIPEATSDKASQRKSKAIHLTFERLPPLGEIPLMGVTKRGRQYISYLNIFTQE